MKDPNDPIVEHPDPTTLDLQRWTAEYHAAISKGNMIRAGNYASRIAGYWSAKATTLDRAAAQD